MVGAGHDFWCESHRPDVLDGRRLELGLSGLEVGAQTVHPALLPGQFGQTTAQRVLTPAIDERTTLQHRCRGIDETGRQGSPALLLRHLDQLEQSQCRVGPATVGAERTVGLDAGRPDDGGVTDDAVAPLEVADVGSDGFERFRGRGGLPLRQSVGCLGVLAGSDEASIVVPPKNLGIVHLLANLGDQIVIQYLMGEEGIAQPGRADVPSPDRGHGGVGQSADSVGVSDPAVSSALFELGDAAVVVGRLGLTLGTGPGEGAAVGQDSGQEGRAVGSAEADDEEAEAAVRLGPVGGIGQEGRLRIGIGAGPVWSVGVARAGSSTSIAIAAAAAAKVGQVGPHLRAEHAAPSARARGRARSSGGVGGRRSGKHVMGAGIGVVIGGHVGAYEYCVKR